VTYLQKGKTLLFNMDSFTDDVGVVQAFVGFLYDGDYKEPEPGPGDDIHIVPDPRYPGG
jgi:hypothetical protein